MTPREPLPLRHPAVVLAALTAALCALYSVTFVIYDPDIWQHLTVGKAILSLRHVPTTQIWIWPTFGEPNLTPSWLFRALLWPFWAAGDIWGLYVWRWLTTLAALGVVWAAARRMGARGLTPLWVIALAALTYRHRSQVRPETLVAVLLALQLWLLEARRLGGADRSPWLIAIAWVWINSHISYPIGFAVIGAYLIEAHWSARRPGADPGRSAGSLWLVALAALAVSFLNPFGWRALWEPFDYYLHWKGDPLYFTIAELRPLMWGLYWKTGLPLLMAGWPLLLLARARREGLDLAEALLCALFTWMALGSQRFVGYYALVAAPFVSRDLAGVLGRRGWRVLSIPPLARAALVSLACIGIGVLEWSRPETPFGVGLDMTQYPKIACDFIASRGIGGRGFNEYYNGGYMLWRFWPVRERLPFMDIHQSGTPEDRRLYPYVFANRERWDQLDARYHFDYALLDGAEHTIEGNQLPDFLDADSTWALVFRDDVAALYLRRHGPLQRVIVQDGYLLAPGGIARLERLGPACQQDSVLRYWVQVELDRQAKSSPFNARANSLLANFALMENRYGAARAHLEAALRVAPTTYAAHERLGAIALTEGHAEDALREFALQDRAGEGSDALELYRARAYERLSRWSEARDAYGRYLSKHPGDAAGSAGMQAVEARLRDSGGR